MEETCEIVWLPGHVGILVYQGNGTHLLRLTLSGSLLSPTATTLRIVHLLSGVEVATLTVGNGATIVSATELRYLFSADLIAGLDVGSYGYEVWVTLGGEPYALVAGFISVATLASMGECDPVPPDGEQVVQVNYTSTTVQVVVAGAPFDPAALDEYPDDETAAADRVPLLGMYWVSADSDAAVPGTLRRRTV